MATYDVDLFVIGAGSGGVRAARMAAAEGARVAIAEEKHLGGTCVNVGCVPKKLMVYASHFAEDFEDAKGFGWTVGASTHNWKQLIENKNAEIHRLNGIYQNILEKAGVEILYGRARLKGNHQVSIDDKIITAEKILITVGGKPDIPSLPGSEFAITSDDVFFLEERPDSIMIIGGGYIAVEFASIFNSLGTEVHLVYRGPQLLKHFDHAAGQFATGEMKKKGITIHFSSNLASVTDNGGRLTCLLDTGVKLDVERLMFATGRKQLSDDLGLETTSVRTRDNASIEVNERFQTDEASVFALGDVIGTPELTPVALAQAMVFVDQQFGSDLKTMTYENIPTAIFCQPNIGTVGLSEEQARAKNLSCDVYTSEFRHLKHTLSGSSERVFMKMLVDTSSQKIVGMHMVGPEAGEIIQGFAVAVKAGLTKQDIDQTIGIHPTAAEEFVTMRKPDYSF